MSYATVGGYFRTGSVYCGKYFRAGSMLLWGEVRSEGDGMYVDVARENSLYPNLVRGHQEVSRSPESS